MFGHSAGLKGFGIMFTYSVPDADMKDSYDWAALSIFQMPKVTRNSVIPKLPEHQPSHLLNPNIEQILMFSPLQNLKIIKRSKYKYD